MRSITLFLAATLAFAVETVQTPIDNDQAKVLNVTVQPREKSRLHQHKVNRVMVYLTPGQQELTFPNAPKSVLNFKAGEMKWSPAGGMHMSEITSANPVNLIEIELKKPGAGLPANASPLDPVKVDPKHYKVEMENDQVRVLRVIIGPHQSTPVHEHVLNRVLTYISDQNVRVTTTDGKSEIARHKPGEVSLGGPAKHKEENLNDTPFEVVVVEFKY